ncbi:hypothetical protein [Larkinella rosea]|uniref:Apea-like HEPN domain-containing protein n=1 Tax=Larkinella rosea TaxID=2025312 RepID=A0A3P1BTN5_9BACT|nr:hypothetical protein [Larkinella rosea]RRB03894.1 hypothetical protein EHT25_10185 [Larkinella rosea]
MKNNILRRVTCFYAGTIKLPTSKLYALDNIKKDKIEFGILRNFKALNTIDYEKEYSLNGDSYTIKTNNSIIPEGTIELTGKFNNSSIAMVAQVPIPIKGVMANARKISFNINQSELVLLHYLFNVDTKNNSLADIDIKFYKNAFTVAIDSYIKAAADYRITPMSNSGDPLYFEIVEYIFDTNVSQNEMRKRFGDDPYGTKKFEGYRGQFDENGFFTKINRDIPIETPNVENNFMAVISSNDPAGKLELSDIFSRVLREIHINNNYKYALLEAFTFAESVTYRYIKMFKIRAGIDEKIIKEFDRPEVTFNYKLNLEIPVLFSLTKEEKEIIKEIDKIKGRRNKIIHGSEGVLPVTKAEALNSIAKAHDYYLILQKRFQ